MAEKAAPIAHPKTRPPGLGLGIPLQSRRGGQPDLRRVTLTPASSSATPDPPTARSSPTNRTPLRDSGRTPRRDDWVRDTRSLIVGSDSVVVILAVLIASFITVDADFRFGFSWAMEGSAWLLGGLVVMWWLVSLTVEGVWDTSALTNTTVAVRRILLASLMVFAGVGIFGYLSGSDLARPYLLVVAPAGIAGLLVNHWFWQYRFSAFRRTLDHQHIVVVARATPGISGPTAQIPVDRFAVAPRAASHMHLSRRQAAAKTVLDVTVAVVGLLLLSPVLLAAAILILLADGGPVLHQQEYVGRAGKVFKSWTFRCTPYGAKARPAVTLASAGDDRGPEYGLATTSIGHLLRRTGLAEAPLLVSVLARQMSVVGPKPLSPAGSAPGLGVGRPGVTGRWRVVARPAGDTGPEVDDVEDWSVMRDVNVIARTLGLGVTGRLSRNPTHSS